MKTTNLFLELMKNMADELLQSIERGQKYGTIDAQTMTSICEARAEILEKIEIFEKLAEYTDE